MGLGQEVVTYIAIEYLLPSYTISIYYFID